MIERRRFYRVKDGSAFVLYPAGEGMTCSLEDISCGGLCFKSSSDVINSPDLKGEIRLSNPRLKSTLTVPAHVKPIWSKKIGDRFKVGAEFININDHDKDFILKRIDRIAERQKLGTHWRKIILHSLLIISILAGAALFIFQQRTFTLVQDSLKTALSYTEKDRLRFKSAFDSAVKEKRALQVELNDTKTFLVQVESLLKSDRIKFNGEITKLKKDISTLKGEVNRLSDKNIALETRLHDLKELRLAVCEVKREIYLKKVMMQKRLDHIKSLAGNKGYIIRDREFTSGTKGVTINVLPAETRGVNNWE